MNGIEPGGFPHSVWSRISRQILAEESEQLFLLGDARGEEGLREALAQYLYHARGVICDAKQIILGAGNDYLLMLLRIILGKSCDIAMENPTYLNAGRCFSRLGHRVIPVKMDEDGMLPEDLACSGADIAYVMPSHQFPTGSVMPIQRRKKLLAWAAEGTDRFLIEDDYDSEFRYRGKPIPALQGSDTQDKVIYLGTFSKSLAPAVRISYMVLPQRLLPKYEERAENFSVTVSRIDQKILEEFLRSGSFERHLNRRRLVYRAKHDQLLTELARYEDAVTVSGEYAGVHLVVKLKREMTEKEAVERAAAEGVRVYGISEYCLDNRRIEEQNPVLILGYASIRKEDITNAVECLRRAWQL